MSAITNVARFEEEYGKLLRSTPEYHGLGRTALKAALAKRTAIHLDTREWVPDPICVSDKALHLWLQKYHIPAGIDELQGRNHHLDISSPADLDLTYGCELRRRIALGFTGYRAAERYLSAVGIAVRHQVVMRWYDVYGRVSDDEIQRRYFEDDHGLRPIVREAELREWDAQNHDGPKIFSEEELARHYDMYDLEDMAPLGSPMRIWRDVEGLSVQQAI